MSTIPLFFFFNDTATTEIYTLSLHDALPICASVLMRCLALMGDAPIAGTPGPLRSEEHTSELQSHLNLVCRLLLEKKKIPIPQRRHRYSDSPPPPCPAPLRPALTTPRPEQTP